MFWVIDRVEGALAVLYSEGGKRAELPAADLPPGVGEGCWGRLEGGAFLPDEGKTRRRQGENARLLDQLLR